MIYIYIFIITIVILSRTVTAQVWSDNFKGLDSLWSSFDGSKFIYDLYNYHDTVLFMGGAFEYANSNLCKSIASWNTDTINIYQEGVEIGGGKCHH